MKKGNLSLAKIWVLGMALNACGQLQMGGKGETAENIPFHQHENEAEQLEEGERYAPDIGNETNDDILAKDEESNLDESPDQSTAAEFGINEQQELVVAAVDLSQAFSGQIELIVFSGYNRCDASKYNLLANLDTNLNLLVIQREINLDKLQQVCPMVFEPVKGSLTVSVPAGLDWKEIKLMHYLQLGQQVSLGLI